MKQVFYSEKLKKYFDTEKECVEAEKAYDQANIEKEKAKAKRTEDAKAVENAYKNSIEVRKEAAKMIEEANKLVEEADQKYYAARREFINKYGSFHMSYSNVDGEEKVSIGDLFYDAFKDLFGHNFNLND